MNQNQHKNPLLPTQDTPILNQNPNPKNNKKLPISTQTKLLIIKNLRIFRRQLSFFVYHLVLLSLVYLWMLFITYLVKHQSPMSRTTTFPPQPINTFKKCGDSSMDDTKNCLSLGIVIVDDSQKITYDSIESNVSLNELNKHVDFKDWISRAIYDLGNKLNLSQDDDIKVIYQGSDMEELYDQMQGFSEIKNMVSFCNEYDFFKNSTLSVNCGGLDYMGFEVDLNVYGIHYNYTRSMPNYLRNLGTPITNDVNSILLKKTIDESILNFHNEETHSFSIPYKPTKHCSNSYLIDDSQDPIKLSNKILTPNQEKQTKKNKINPTPVNVSPFSYELEMMNFPEGKNRLLDNFDSSSWFGSFFHMFIVLLSFVKFSQFIAKEKDKQLRKGLIPLGLNSFAYWFSWICCICAFDVLFVLLIIFGGMLCGFPLFTEINVLITFFLFISCFWSYRFLSILVTVLCSDYRSANKMYFSILVISIFLQGKFQYVCILLLLLS
jgi:hypothetical protein